MGSYEVYAPQPRRSPKRRRAVVTAGVTIAFLLAGVVTIGIVAASFAAMRHSGPALMAIGEAERSQIVMSRIGRPLKPGWTLTGSIETGPAGGYADLSIPVSGPRGKARLYVLARKIGGRWQADTLEVKFQGEEERIDLLGGR